MTPCLGSPDTGAPAPERRTLATLPPSVLQVREVLWACLVAADVKGRACPSIEGEQRQLLGGSSGFRTGHWWYGWLPWLGVVSLVRLCAYELGWRKQSVANRAEATVLGACGVDVNEADGAKCSKGSSAGVLAQTEVGGKSAR